MRPDRRINEWRAPGHKSVAKAATNERQVAVALSGGEILYFELNPQVRPFKCLNQLVMRRVTQRARRTAQVGADMQP